MSVEVVMTIRVDGETDSTWILVNPIRTDNGGSASDLLGAAAKEAGEMFERMMLRGWESVDAQFGERVKAAQKAYGDMIMAAYKR